MSEEIAVPEEKLTPKQRLFINEYLIDLNGTQAAIRAGYAEGRAGVQAHELLKTPAVAQAVERAMTDRVLRLEVSQDWVVARLVENVDHALRAVPVLDREGNPIGDYTYQGAVANKALELLGKHVGMFGTKLEVGGDPNRPILVAHEARLTLANLLQAAGHVEGLSGGARGELPAARPLLAEPDESVAAASNLPVRPAP